MVDKPLALMEQGFAARARGDHAAAAACFAAVAAVTPPGDHGPRLDYAASLLELRRAEAAWKVYAVVLAEEPQQIAALMGLGYVERMLGNHAASLDHFTAAATAAPPGTVWPNVEQANALRFMGQDEAAEAIYRAVKWADEMHALLGLGHIARKRGEHITALDHFTAACTAAPAGNMWPLLERAQTLCDLNQARAAEALYADVLAARPGDMHALLGLGRIARMDGKWTEALAHFAAADAAAPEGEMRPRLEQANTLRDADRAEAAETIYRAVLDEQPGEMHALLGIGHVARMRGNEALALECFIEAEGSAPPGNAWPRLEQAHSLRALGRTDAAAMIYLDVLATQPRNVTALMGLGQIARSREDHDEALHQFLAAIAAAQPGDFWPHLEQAHTLLALNRIDEAETVYLAVLAEHPELFHPLLGLGQVARWRDDHQTAIRHFTAAIAVAPPGDAWASLELAQSLRDIGHHPRARAVLLELLLKKPGLFHAVMSLGQTERSAGQRAEAFRLFQQAHNLEPASPIPLLEMAREEHALGRPNEAMALLKTVLELEPDHPGALLELGDIGRTARDHERALGLFLQAIALRPKSPWGYLGATRALAELGEQDAASDMLDRAETECGDVPDIGVVRIELLRQAGHWHSALHLAREAFAQAPRHFGVWVQLFQTGRLLFTPAQVDACLAAAPATTLAERATLHHFRGQAAFECWNIGEAIAHFAIARELRPDEPWVLFDLARARLLALDVTTARRDIAEQMRLSRSAILLQGGSLKISQTHLGQILDEFVLDQGALADLVALRDLPPAAMVEPLCEVVRQYPDYTPAAMQLLIALRRAGMLSPPEDERPGLPTGIPHHIVHYWDSPQPPAEIAALMQSWRDAHPRFVFELFDDRRAQAFLRQHFGSATLLAYRRSAEVAQRADLFRLAYLFQNGGYYIDADDRCLAPLQSVLPRAADLVLYQEDYGTVGNNFIAAGPRHHVIGFALNEVVQAINRGDRDLLWFLSGPGLLTRAVAQSIAHPSNAGNRLQNGTRILTRTALHQAVAMHCKVAYKETARHWSKTAFASGARKPHARLQVSTGSSYDVTKWKMALWTDSMASDPAPEKERTL